MVEVTVVVVVVVVVNSGCSFGACQCETIAYCNIKFFHYHTTKCLRHFTVQSGSLNEFDSYLSGVKFTLREVEV